MIVVDRAKAASACVGRISLDLEISNVLLHNQSRQLIDRRCGICNGTTSYGPPGCRAMTGFAPFRADVSGRTGKRGGSAPEGDVVF